MPLIPAHRKQRQADLCSYLCWVCVLFYGFCVPLSFLGEWRVVCCLIGNISSSHDWSKNRILLTTVHFPILTKSLLNNEEMVINSQRKLRRIYSNHNTANCDLAFLSYKSHWEDSFHSQDLFSSRYVVKIYTRFLSSFSLDMCISL